MPRIKISMGISKGVRTVIWRVRQRRKSHGTIAIIQLTISGGLSNIKEKNIGIAKMGWAKSIKSTNPNKYLFNI